MDWFRKESEVEYWLQPYTGRVMLSGYRRVLHKDSRLFFDLYGQLLWLGYTQTQLVDYMLRMKWAAHEPPLPEEIAFTKAIYHLARAQNLKPSRKFLGFPEGGDPHNWHKGRG